MLEDKKSSHYGKRWEKMHGRDGDTMQEDMTHSVGACSAWTLDLGNIQW